MFLPFSNDQLEALDVAHEDIRHVKGETPPAKPWRTNYEPETPWAAVFRKPTTGEAESFEGKAHNERAAPGAMRDYAKALVVAVSLDGKHTVCLDRADPKSKGEVRKAWDDLRAKYPAAHIAAQADLLSLSGQARDEGGKD